jgi:hypothetical protein
VISRTRRFCRALTVEAITTASLAEATLQNRDNRKMTSTFEASSRRSPTCENQVGQGQVFHRLSPSLLLEYRVFFFLSSESFTTSATHPNRLPLVLPSSLNNRNPVCRNYLYGARCPALKISAALTANSGALQVIITPLSA